MNIVIAIPVLFLAVGWAWAIYYKEINTTNLVLSAIAAQLILPHFI